MTMTDIPSTDQWLAEMLARGPLPETPPGGPSGTERSVADVAERLMREYGGPVSLATISSTVLGAARDLAGEVPPAGLAEMLYRLARQRLSATM